MSDHMLDARQAIERLTADNCRLADDRNNWQKRAEAEERAKQQLADALQRSQHWISESNGKNNVLTAERDAAERERAESRAEVVQLLAERDAARADRRQAEEDNQGLTIEVANMRAGLELATDLRDRALAEAEGLRVDLLAHPPELHQELAIERKRHLELMEDYDRQEVRIAMLEDAVKRAEKAQGKPELQGYLAAIVQLAHTAGGMV